MRGMLLPHRILRISLATLLPAATVLIWLTQPLSASTQTHKSQLTQAAAIALQEIRHLDVGRHAIDQRIPALRGQGQGQVNSTNWAGYADTGSGFSKVTGSWTEPAVTCSNGPPTYAAFWVGLDGYSSSTVEQDGTLIECLGGVAHQYSWWEMYPNGIEMVSAAVEPGDLIKASVVRTTDRYALAVTDSTHTSATFSTTQSCPACINTSAEWIVEAPSDSSGVLPLANFTTWNVSSATTTTGGVSGVISTFPDVEIIMTTPAGKVLAHPSALTNAGNGFSVP